MWDATIIGWIVVGSGTLILALCTAVWQWATGRFAALETAMAAVEAKANRFELQVAKEYVSNVTLEKMEDRILGELREITLTQRQIFEELKLKQDK